MSRTVETQSQYKNPDNLKAGSKIIKLKKKLNCKFSQKARIKILNDKLKIQYLSILNIARRLHKWLIFLRSFFLRTSDINNQFYSKIVLYYSSSINNNIFESFISI